MANNLEIIVALAVAHMSANFSSAENLYHAPVILNRAALSGGVKSLPRAKSKGSPA
jgi:hypothetical protein